MDARTKFTVAMKQSCVDLPQIATLLLRLSPREKQGIGTVGADERLRFYYDPEIVESMSLEDLSFEQKMAVTHAFLGHAARGSFIDGSKQSTEAWRKATRISAVEFLKNYGQQVPDHAPCCDNTTDSNGKFLPKGLCSEEYFSILLETPEQEPEPEPDVDGEEEGGSGQDDGQEQGQGGPSSEGGSVQDSQPREWEDQFNDNDINSRPDGATDAELEAMQAKMSEGFKSMGRSCSGDFQMLQNKVNKPKLRPEQLLRMAIASNITKFRRGTKHPTYRRVSRRQQFGDPIIRPSHIDPTPKVTVVVDTSASMSRQERELGLGVVDLALKGMKLDEVRVVGADTKIASDQKNIRNVSSVRLSGGGGTCLDLVVNQLLSEPANSLPDLLILVTDGGTEWPSKNKVPFVACITAEDGGAYIPYKPPSWMPLVYVG